MTILQGSDGKLRNLLHRQVQVLPVMTNDWFNEYMFRLVVNKKYASEQLLKEFDQKPTMLTPDDPLFQLED